MARVLIIAALIGLVAWWVMSRLRARDAADDTDRADPAAPGTRRRARKARPPQAQPMVACAHCGVHLPRSDAVADGAGRLFCGDAHRIAGPR
jgi:uncharacterized protein